MSEARKLFLVQHGAVAGLPDQSAHLESVYLVVDCCMEALWRAGIIVLSVFDVCEQKFNLRLNLDPLTFRMVKHSQSQALPSRSLSEDSSFVVSFWAKCTA